MEETIEKALLHLDQQGHVIGYTLMPIIEGQENTYLVNEPTQELLDQYQHYKVVDDQLVRMTDDEYIVLYPEPTQEPSEIDMLGQMATEAELERMELGQRMTDLEQMVLEGGVGNV